MNFTKTILLVACCTLLFYAKAQQWKTFTPTNSSIPFNKVYTMGIDSDERVWFGTNVGATAGTGLAYFDTNGDTIIPLGPNTGLIYGIYAEKDVTWILIPSCLMRLDSAGWTFPRPDVALGVTELSYAGPIVIDGQHQLWLKPDNIEGGLLKLVNNTWTRYTTTNSTLPAARINDMCSSGSTLWMATQNKGLLKHENGTFTAYHTGNSSITSDTILNVCAGKNNTVWMVSKDKKLIRYDGSAFTAYASPELYSITDMLVDASSNVWLATSHGLIKFNGSTFSVFNTSNSGISEDNLLCLQLDRHQNLWIGTFTQGLSVYNENGVQTGVKELKQNNNEIGIYPNPASDRLHVTLKNNEKITRYVISDMMGRSTEIPCYDNEINLSGFDRGMYILEVYTENSRMRKQFFRQ